MVFINKGFFFNRIMMTNNRHKVFAEIDVRGPSVSCFRIFSTTRRDPYMVVTALKENLLNYS